MRLYAKYIGIIIKAQMQYKSSLILSIVATFIVSFSGFVGIYFLFQRFSSVEGFTFEQVLLCFAMSNLSFSSAEMLFRGFDSFPRVIRNAEFDRFMVRPRGAMLQVLCSRMDLHRLGRLSQALLIIAYALPRAGIVFTADKVLTVVLMYFGGISIFAGLFIVYASFCFFTIEGLEFMNVFTDGGRELSSYPLSIYGETVFKLFTFVVPLTLVQYYPLTYLLGMSGNILHMLLPLAGPLFILPCYGFWRFGMRHYKSAGS